MSIYVENKSFVAQMFKERSLRPFTATQDEVNMAKQSLIFKKKCNSNVHSLLFCKSFISSSSVLATQNQKRILEEEKSKYFEYVRKSYKEKIPQEFQNENKLKKALKNKLFEMKQNESKNKEDLSNKRQRDGFEEPIKKNKQVKVSKEAIPNKKLKNKIIEDEKKIIADQQMDENQLVQEDNFESEVDLQNDQIQQSFHDEEI